MVAALRFAAWAASGGDGAALDTARLQQRQEEEMAALKAKHAAERDAQERAKRAQFGV